MALHIRSCPKLRRETLHAIMNLLGVDIPPLDGLVQLCFLIIKKRSLELMECVSVTIDRIGHMTR